MSPFFSPHDPFDDITQSAMHSPFHPPMCPSDAQMDSNTHLMLMYTIESDPLAPSYPSMI